ncbi:putative ribonuclease H-like domain-containing protein [Tanacetum coccineum]|uniref:Ribonuclease H-like domain-containing protein n=1 Tax=Tanacetum coccineum TaxID=301880 RepID=A0ABQ5J1I4_9ASTR
MVLKNKRDARGIVVRNKARLVAQGHRQEEALTMNEVICSNARIEDIRLFLAFTSIMGFYVVEALYGSSSSDQALVYVDDIILGLTKKAGVDEFEVLMKVEFEMMLWDILMKFGLESVRTATTPYEASKPKSKDEPDDAVNVHYRSMIVKKIFKYLKGQPKLGLWYPRDSPFVLEAYSDSDYAGSHGDRKSTTGGCQFLGRRLISWQCKKQTIVATSSTEAEYVAAAKTVVGQKL